LKETFNDLISTVQQTKIVKEIPLVTSAAQHPIEHACIIQTSNTNIVFVKMKRNSNRHAYIHEASKGKF